jgi:DNA-binding response OmpR family regulator
VQRVLAKSMPQRFGNVTAKSPLTTSSAEAGTFVGRPHILLAEDNEMICEMLKICLEMDGYRVSVTDTVERGAALARESPIDLVLSDMRLRDGTGCDLMTKIRETRVIPGIMMSGYSDQAHQNRSKLAGFDQYLVKPVDPDELSEHVAKILNVAGK